MYAFPHQRRIVKEFVDMAREEIERSFQYNMTNAFIEWDKAVNTKYNEDNEKAFYEGAYAAQKYLIKKIDKWIDTIDFDMRYWNPEEGVCVGDFMEDLRKVME